MLQLFVLGKEVKGCTPATVAPHELDQWWNGRRKPWIVVTAYQAVARILKKRRIGRERAIQKVVRYELPGEGRGGWKGIRIVDNRQAHVATLMPTSEGNSCTHCAKQDRPPGGGHYLHSMAMCPCSLAQPAWRVRTCHWATRSLSQVFPSEIVYRTREAHQIGGQADQPHCAESPTSDSNRTKVTKPLPRGEPRKMAKARRVTQESVRLNSLVTVQSIVFLWRCPIQTG